MFLHEEISQKRANIVSLKKNDTRRRMCKFFDKQIERFESHNGCYYSQLDFEPTANEGWIVNPLGARFLINISADCNGFCKIWFHSMARVALMKVKLEILGLELGEDGHQYSLDSEVLRTVIENTVDPFSGRSLRFDIEKRRLWSVGNDGVDDGGEFLEPLQIGFKDLGVDL
jgi:hypothetical protein